MKNQNPKHLATSQRSFVPGPFFSLSLSLSSASRVKCIHTQEDGDKNLQYSPLPGRESQRDSRNHLNGIIRDQIVRPSVGRRPDVARKSEIEFAANSVSSAVRAGATGERNRNYIIAARGGKRETSRGDVPGLGGYAGERGKEWPAGRAEGRYSKGVTDAGKNKITRRTRLKGSSNG